jgi:ribonuclease HI
MEVWRTVKQAFNIQLVRRDFMSTKHWLFEFLERATELEATVFAIGCWHISDARNDTRNNHSTPDPKRTSARIVAYVHMVVQHCFKAKPGTRRESNKPEKWTPPPPGEVLANVDAALFADRRRMAMGAVFRDHSGNCLAAASEPLAGFTSPELAEALALHRAVSIAADKGYDKVTFTSDCLSLIQRLSSPNPDRSPVGLVVKDIKRLVAGFSSATFRHVRRSLNEAAHTLARTCDVSGLGFIYDFAPDCIRKTLCIDVL